jgi:hypothetical protein
MGIDKTGRQSVFLAVTRRSLAALALLLLPVLSACTTAEGTNALVDPSTFEREVMTSTLQGLDIVPQDQKQATNQRRAPLVLPKNTAMLPTPTKENTAALPADSDNVQINTAGLTDADLQRLRNARVVDLRSLDGRPLTDTERKQLTARMSAANVTTAGTRPLTLPPVQYFADYKGRDTICKTPDGNFVALNDPKCPQAIRDALRREGPQAVGVDAGINSDMNTLTKKTVSGN